ncbi:MAG: hypothetical protein L6Q99_12865 [Planctomycetes bacterium]|nr:hypothetical protein [Planctomycetota bacterium]
MRSWAFFVSTVCALACAPSPDGASARHAPPDAAPEQRVAESELWRADHADAERVKELVLAELREPGLPEWAGVYSDRGLYETMTLYVAPRSGFAYFFRGCVCDEARSGGVTVNGDVLELGDAEIDDDELPSLTHELVPVRVDPARYLLTPALVVMACNEWNQGRLWSGGFTHESYESDRLRGPLRVPAKYQKYVLDEPIVGRVTRTWIERRPAYGGETWTQTRIRIDVGADRRALGGMSFLVSREHTADPQDCDEFLVEAVCEAGELELGSVYAGTTMPAVGARASTSPR